MPVLCAEGKRLSSVLSWFDAEQARHHRTRHFAAAAVVHTMPEADVKQLVPTERRFDLLLFVAEYEPAGIYPATPRPAPGEVLTPGGRKSLPGVTQRPRVCGRACLLWLRPAPQWHRSMLCLLSASCWSCSVCVGSLNIAIMSLLHNHADRVHRLFSFIVANVCHWTFWFRVDGLPSSLVCIMVCPLYTLRTRARLAMMGDSAVIGRCVLLLESCGWTSF